MNKQITPLTKELALRINLRKKHISALGLEFTMTGELIHTEDNIQTVKLRRATK